MAHSGSGVAPTRRDAHSLPWIEFQEKTVRKRGVKFRIEREIEAMRYVQEHTSIPVPNVIQVHLDESEDEARSWMLMERLPGVELGSVWTEMDGSAQAQTISELKSYFDELHSLRPPTTTRMGPAWIGSCSQGAAYDHRIDNMRTCGPFASIGAFHDMLVAPLGDLRPDWLPKYRGRLPDDDEVVFVHADFGDENVLIDAATGRVTGIIDWEMAGFWPRWWEYRKGLFGSSCQPWWEDILNKIMVAYPDATEADMDLEMF